MTIVRKTCDEGKREIIKALIPPLVSAIVPPLVAWLIEEIRGRKAKDAE